MEPVKFRTLLTEAVKFWEPARLIYNGWLLLILTFYLNRADAFVLLKSSEFLANCTVFAVIANVLYTLAYIPDLALRYTLLSSTAKRVGVWVILALGLIVATIMTRFIADELVRAYAWTKT